VLPGATQMFSITVRGALAAAGRIAKDAQLVDFGGGIAASIQIADHDRVDVRARQRAFALELAGSWSGARYVLTGSDFSGRAVKDVVFVPPGVP